MQCSRPVARRDSAECALPADRLNSTQSGNKNGIDIPFFIGQCKDTSWKETALHHDLAGKSALVTGGSPGTGATVARALAGAGADVAITYRNSRQVAENIAAEMRAMGVRTWSVRADQADLAAAAAVVSQAAEAFGRLDIVVNNAAVAVLGLIDGPDPDNTALDRQIRVNYTSIVAAIRAAARVLPGRGRIINIGPGIATRTGASRVAHHAGTKAVLAGFTRGAARDLAPKGITVTCCRPASWPRS
jgi:NAD(P)-dependent dehydrogenase (short-subunit alcohol dehydrogenase family)